MALNVDVGTITQPGSIGTQKTTLANDFDLKALILYTSGLASDGTATAGDHCIGAATDRGGTASQWYHGTHIQDGNVSMQVGRWNNTTDIIKLNLRTDTSAIVDCEIAFVEFTTEAGSSNNNAFTVNWQDLHTTASIKVGYIALGGSDITDALCGSFTGNGTTSTQDVTVTAGFGQPDLLLFCGPGVHALGEGSGDALFHMAFAKSATARRATSVILDDANAVTTLQFWQGDKAIRGTFVGEPDDGIADLSAKASWPTDGFQLTWSDLSDNPWNYLALKGTFQSAVGSNSCPTAGSPPVNQDNDAGFVPKLGMVWGGNLPTSASVDTTHADLGQIYVGAYDGTDEWCMGFTGDDAALTSRGDSEMDQTKVMRMYTPATPTLDASADGAFSGNNFRLVWDDVGSAAREYNWLAIGDAAAAVTDVPEIVMPRAYP